MECLWFAWTLINFLPLSVSRGLEWLEYSTDDHHQVNDDWLSQLMSTVRERFVQKWVIDHVMHCKVCSECFAVGLDGKRGMKRFLCASLEGKPRFVEEVGAHLHQGCHRKPAWCSYYCKQCDARQPASADETAGQILNHRSTADGSLEYQVLHCDIKGQELKCWQMSEDVAASAKRSYERDRLKVSRKDVADADAEGGSQRKSRKRMRARVGEQVAEFAGTHALCEDANDKGACNIDKETAGSALPQKRRRRRLGGIIAAVSGCRIFLDWEEHQFGEGTSRVYVVLARLMANILASTAAGHGGRKPEVVFFDNACALRRFAINPKRCKQTVVTRLLRETHYMLDKFHALNHTQCLKDPAQARVLNPRHEANKQKADCIDTSACEQAFSFVDRITYVGMNMAPGRFAAYLYMIMDLEKVVRKRTQGRNFATAET